jgi:hypothetical protein
MSPRPLTGAEQRQLERAADRAKAAKTSYEQALADRDVLISDLLAGGVRAVDVAYVLELTPKAIADARARARLR